MTRYASNAWGSFELELQALILSFLADGPIQDACLVETCECEHSVHGVDDVVVSAVPETLQGRFLRDGRFLCGTELVLYTPENGVAAAAGLEKEEVSGLERPVLLFRVDQGRLEATWWVEFSDTQPEDQQWYQIGDVVRKRCLVTDSKVALNSALAARFSAVFTCQYVLNQKLQVWSGDFMPSCEGPDVLLRVMPKGVDTDVLDEDDGSEDEEVCRQEHIEEEEDEEVLVVQEVPAPEKKQQSIFKYFGQRA
mmetsp:Transcript_73705/g.130117  ORF Transcript_73705/g.130117 Transcript_73705/m.130117 type:complete len:252 (+) Transcript_73705:74-829(+)